MTSLRRFLFIVSCLALAACAGEAPLPQGGPRLIVGMAPDGTALEALVEALPPGAVIREVRLVGPEGSRLSGVPLEQSQRGAAPGGLARPEIAVGATGGSASGIDPSVGLAWGPQPAGPRGTWRDSRWLIPLPAALRPRLAVGDWRVELTYLDADGISRVMRRRAAPGG